jgi:hypothetical protein
MLFVEPTPLKSRSALCGIVDALIEEALRKKRMLFLASSNEMLGKREFDAAGFFILNYNYLNKMLFVEPTPLKSASFVKQNSVGLPKLFHINRIDESFSPQTALCGIVCRAVKKIHCIF